MCTSHGAAAPQVKAAARRRLEQATDALAAKLLGIALDDGASEAVRLAAIKDALDRGGLGAPKTVSVELGPRPYEEVFDGIYNGPRFDPTDPTDQARDGTPDHTRLEPAELEPAPPPAGPEVHQDASAEVVGMVVPETIVDAEVVDIDESDNGLVDFETAVTQAAQVKRALGQFGPVRAIPPGRRR